MRYANAFIVLSLLALLAGCEASMTLPQQVKAVQDWTVDKCSYLPKSGAVEAMLAAANPQAAGWLAVAKGICDVMVQWQQNKSSALTSECPGMVNGVCVQGEFKPKGN